MKYIIVNQNISYNDEYYYYDEIGGQPTHIYNDKEIADAVCLRLNWDKITEIDFSDYDPRWRGIDYIEGSGLPSAINDILDGKPLSTANPTQIKAIVNYVNNNIIQFNYVVALEEQ